MSDALAFVLGPRPWSWLEQVHGARTWEVTRPGEHTGLEGDALVSAVPDCLLAVFAADCALVAFGSPEGIVGVAHSGWRSLVAGVIDETVAEMRRLGASKVMAWRSACIHPCCYEFEPEERERAEERFGASLAGLTSTGKPAFDLPAGVRVALERADATLVGEEPSCTSCTPGWFSWRARRDSGRIMLAAWAAP